MLRQVLLERFDGDAVLDYLSLPAVLRRRDLHGGAQGQREGRPEELVHFVSNA